MGEWYIANAVGGLGSGTVSAISGIMAAAVDKGDNTSGKKNKHLARMGMAAGISDTLSGGLGFASSIHDFNESQDRPDQVKAVLGMLSSLVGIGGGLAGMAGSGQSMAGKDNAAADKALNGLSIAGGLLGMGASGIGIHQAFKNDPNATGAKKAEAIAGFLGSAFNMGSGISGLFKGRNAAIASGILGALSGVAGIAGGFVNAKKAVEDSRARQVANMAP